MINITYHEKDFGLPASWTFSATSHGKGPVDGIGAAVKSRATRFLLSGSAERAFLSPEDLLTILKKLMTINTFKKTLEPRWLQISKKPWIDGIQSKHQFNPIGIGKITCCRISNSEDFKTFELF
ncbi:unnamed protein product [Rotaria sordida]|uniref:Uncharacterized protein n=2 Tax=Rotaria sordida TaxID=392033 RepID=A0A815GZS2_9BILA|nr:unnamed protein product [Rotaria sordida]CAF1558611.1 unnamed protein product [Rotaria sordida]